MNDQKNTFIAIALSAVLLLGWQYFVGMPQMQKQEQIKQDQQKAQQAPVQAPAGPAGSQQAAAPPSTPGAPSAGAPPAGAPQAPGVPGAGPTVTVSRDNVIAQTARVPIETPRLKGSIGLKGGRIDDLSLVQYRETVDPKSPAIILLSPSGAPEPFYAEFGWVGAAGTTISLPGADTEWRRQGSGPLGIGQPVTLTWDNGAGLTFRREISVDDKYLFTVKDSVSNAGSAPVTIYPYALISRHGTPHTLGYYILHEGLIGVFGDKGEQKATYKEIEDKKVENFDAVNSWLGFTDKYWAAALLPDTAARVNANFKFSLLGKTKTYQTDYLLDARTIQPGSSAEASGRLFAGAKEVAVVGINFPIGGVGGYNQQLGLNHFDLLIDWGWFYFITKPMFLAIDWLFKFAGNFGVAILLVTVIIKAIFFPLANKSYASMANMKKVQPQMQLLRERYPDDKVKQQQELMELYKREKVNPVSGCLPVVIQIPVFFALYKVLFVTIEMRHAPFFGWIHDLSSPDPTSVFNLFGLVPWDPPAMLAIGAWPLIMGVTMFLQQKLNPTPPDPVQAKMFMALPVVFTFMLAKFPAGLVIYWAWNNLLSIAQQRFIMWRMGVKP